MWCLLNIFASQKSALSRDTTCASKTLKPKSMFWESTIPTYGLGKILQVSCHWCQKAIKIAPKSVWSFSVNENKCCTNLWWQSNKSDRLHNKGCYYKGQYNVTFFCIKRLCIQNKKSHDNLCFPLRRAYLLLFCIYFMQESKYLSIFLFIFSFGKHMWWGKI